jgi:hypothetical protein
MIGPGTQILIVGRLTLVASSCQGGKSCISGQAEIIGSLSFNITLIVIAGVPGDCITLDHNFQSLGSRPGRTCKNVS